MCQARPHGAVSHTAVLQPILSRKGLCLKYMQIVSTVQSQDTKGEAARAL